MLNDPEPRVRRSAADGLPQLGSSAGQTISQLVAMLDSDTDREFVERYSSKTLRRFYHVK